MPIGNIIALGIGPPSDIAHNVLFGLSPNVVAITPTTPGGGGYPITQPPRSSSALLNRDYREREPFKRVTRISAVATADGVVAYARVGIARARGTVTETVATVVVEAKPLTQDATVRAETVRVVARLGRTDRVSAIARSGKRRMSADEWFLMGYFAGQDE